MGEDMQDHPILAENFEVADGVVSGDMLRDPKVIQAVLAQYQAGQGGPLSQSIISTAYVPSRCYIILSEYHQCFEKYLTGSSSG